MSTLTAEQVSYRYGQVSALREVSVEFSPGVTGLLGPNGSGKTTLLALAAGGLRPRRGTITLDGTSVRARAARNHIGVVLQNRALNPHWVGADLVRAAAHLRDLPRPTTAAAHVLELVALGAAASRPIATYSLGQRQRLLLALARVHEPRVLILDEPFDGLDHEARQSMAVVLRERATAGHTIIVSSHILPELDSLVDDIVVLVNGRVVACGPVDTVTEVALQGPREVVLECPDRRKLAAALAVRPWTASISFAPQPEAQNVLRLLVTDSAALAAELPTLAQQAGVTLRRVEPQHQDLDDVFAAIVTP